MDVLTEGVKFMETIPFNEAKFKQIAVGYTAEYVNYMRAAKRAALLGNKGNGTGRNLRNSGSA